MPKNSNSPIDCPSAQADVEGARVYGVMTGAPDGPRVGYLTQVRPLSDRLLALAGDSKPSQLFRIAAPCFQGGCAHFRDDTCTLAQRIVEGMEPVVNALPACQIRSTCRWFRQEGKAACMRCPQIATDTPNASDDFKQIADDRREQTR